MPIDVNDVSIQSEQIRVVRVTLTFQSIDTEECVLDCDGGCSNQAEWIAFTGGHGLQDPAIAFCNGCLTKFETHGAAQQ